ncbi:hypothetical protein BC354_16955 [Vibrio cholerae]|nr:hypothetical protein BC354_16955 [Vibrio cholerae]RGP93476.1 hypothetical protein BC352_16365 [Vibrio cholerae]
MAKIERLAFKSQASRSKPRSIPKLQDLFAVSLVLLTSMAAFETVVGLRRTVHQSTHAISGNLIDLLIAYFRFVAESECSLD